MSHVKLAFAAALILVTSVSNAEDRFNSITAGEERPAGVFSVTDREKGIVTYYAVKELDPRLADAKAGKLSKEEQEQLAKDSLANIPKTAYKIGEMSLPTGDSRLESQPACGWWGWRGGWGFRRWGCGGGCGWGWGGNWVWAGNTWGWGWGWGVGNVGCGWWW